MKETLKMAIKELLNFGADADIICTLASKMLALDETQELADHFYSEGDFKSLYELTVELIDGK